MPTVTSTPALSDIITITETEFGEIGLAFIIGAFGNWYLATYPLVFIHLRLNIPILREYEKQIKLVFIDYLTIGCVQFPTYRKIQYLLC